jgi:hypothetical protein
VIQIVRRLADRLRGASATTITIPPMDGALRPNGTLDQAPTLFATEAPDNLIVESGHTVFSSGCVVFRLPDAGTVQSAEEVARFDHAITCLAAQPDGGFAVGLENGRILCIGGRHDGKSFDGVGPANLRCPTAMTFGDGDTLYLCQGSAQNPPGEWKRDLMQGNASGSVWRIDLRDGRHICLADRLSFPYGLMAGGQDRALIVAESWRHRLIALPADGPGKPTPVLAELPGYPARLTPAADGGAWLSLFAPRSRLIEFVLREHGYRDDMLREIDPEYWIAPALSSGRSFLEPLQCGAVRSMGILKPWAPSRSYGLVLRLDAASQPVASLHSRAGGDRHGITSVLEIGGRLLATSKGGNLILSIDPLSRIGD